MGISASAALIVYRNGLKPYQTEKYHVADESGNRIEYTASFDVVPTVRIRHLDTRTPTIEAPFYVKKNDAWIVNAHTTKQQFRTALGQRHQLFDFESRCGFQ